MMRWGWLLVCVSALAALCAPVLAMAQTADDAFAELARSAVFARDRNVAVQDRPHPEWEARGLHLGGLTAYPRFGLDAGTTDNVYATSTRREADGMFHLRPAVVVQSQRPDHRLSAFAVIDAAMFAAHPSEATTDYAVGAAAVVETPRSLGFEAAAGFARKTEPRTSPDSPSDASTPVRYDLAEGRLGVAAAFNRLRVSARVRAADYAFSDGRSTSGALLAQGFRDRTETTAILRGDYALRPAAAVFIAGGFVHRAYRHETAAVIDRSSSGSRLEVGANFDSSRLVRGEVAVGYLSQDYGGRYASVSGPSARARIDAFPTQLTTLSLTAARAVEDSTIPAAGGYLASTIKVQAHHELLRNLLLHASGAYEADDYRGLQRQDRRTIFGAGLRYLLNRGVVVTAQLDREERRSGGAQRGLAYAVNRATLAVTLRC